MKLYVAGASADLERCKTLAQAARAAGYEITLEWWVDVEHARAAGYADRDLNHETRREQATKDLCAVQLADVLWLVCPPAGVHTTGAWCELATAIVAGVFVVVSGDHRQCLFTAKAQRFFDTHEEALAFLKSIVDEPQASSEVA